MEIEYRKDLHHHYMVIQGNDIKEGAYCIRMLEADGMDGVLKLEERRINNKVQYYYDITSKQTLSVLFTKSALTYDMAKKLFMELYRTIEKAYEYLLNEDDFVLTPEHIFMDLTTEKLYLCYLPGYQKNVGEQIGMFIEYIMNKVDHQDKEAVLLVYSLYAAVREDGFTIDRVFQVLQGNGMLQADIAGSRNKNAVGDKEKEKYDEIDRIDREESENGRYRKPEFEFPFMMEKVTGEKEVLCYPWKTYLYTAALVLGAAFISVLAMKTGALYNAAGTRMDYMKLSALLLILFGIAGYMMKIVWDRKNMITKIIEVQEYIDPREDFVQEKVINERVVKERAAKERAAKERAAKERVANERVANERVVKERAAKERAAKERAAKERVANERVANERAANERVANERVANERVANEKAASEMIAEAPSLSLHNSEQDSATCLLNASREEACYILKPLDLSASSTIEVVSFPFMIGKLKKEVDCCLEKDVISRYHAKLTKEHDSIFITDLNSTNGTFINGEILQPYRRKEIRADDEIAFADLKFRLEYSK